MMAPTISAGEALERLREGNRRFAAGINDSNSYTTQTSRARLLEGQTPFAVILGCSDSRAPVEMVFDQGLGDLFVIRIAGNIVANSQIASVEFAVEELGTQLVVVLGHSFCGAVEATIGEIRQPQEKQSLIVDSIVSRIRPVVEPLLETDLGDDADALMKMAVRANVRVAADRLRHGSENLEHQIQRKEILVVGAEYSLETGLVDFFDGVPG